MMLPREGCAVTIIRDDQLDIISYNPQQTARMGARLGALLEVGDVICLSGDMGAGKTIFASGIGKGWGAEPPLTSPTYNLVHVHRRKKDSTKLYHLDCYRLSDVLEAETIGLDDILNGATISVFEWPEHIKSALPEERLWVDIRIVETTRRSIVLEGSGKRYEDLIVQFRAAALGSKDKTPKP
jgi:tRNA threonylcarbamoyladenosine biosynthesis protein TsaE